MLLVGLHFVNVLKTCKKLHLIQENASMFNEVYSKTMWIHKPLGGHA